MLSTRQIGIIMFGLSILLTVLVVSFYYSVSRLMEVSACPVGGCPAHQLLPIQTIMGLVVVGVMVVFSLILIAQEEKVKVQRKIERKKSDFDVLLDLLTSDERKVVEAVKAQPGIQQNTLRLKTDFSKAKLSNILSDLEKRGIVKKELSGKTNKVYLKKAA